ncbi:GCG_CRPN prefix-to-repeats domain-containing protein [Sphingomonas crusticola]|uniref:GCG_CRPN prefix-to-repeats domain-containing protein n=1 Tax=Sphingomonas crusticola TaxID=1697973 RepID=UPI000E2715AE|nr:hypothetical protein [Sphingomonas crusticola]
MKKYLLLALAAGATLVAAAPADARQGCGPGGHRDYYGHCRPNRGPVYAGPRTLVIGTYYPGRGYWDGRRYYQHRERWHRGWRYR